MVKRLVFFYLLLSLSLSACQVSSLPLETDLVEQSPSQQPASKPATEAALSAAASVEPAPLAPAETVVAPVGEGSRVIFAATDGALWQSTDGGQNWHDGTPSGLRESLTIAGEGMPATLKAGFTEDGFGLAAVSQAQQARIYRTQDGGKNWEESVLIYAQETQAIIAVEVLDEQQAWLLTTRGIGAGNEWVDLYHSQDGGATWSYLAWSNTGTDAFGSIPSGGLKSGISFKDPQMGWMSGSAPIDAVYMLHSRDGGQTWQPFNLPLPADALFSGTSYPPAFFDQQNGLLATQVLTTTDEPGLAFFSTEDGGESWTPKPLLKGQFSAWDWVDAQHGFAAEESEQGQPRLFVTQDSGLSWNSHPLPLAVVSKLRFVSEQVGWAICGWEYAPRANCAGELYVTLDGGRTWEKAGP